MVQGVLMARLLEASAPGTDGTAARAEELLDVKTAAQRLGVSVDWVYRQAARLPFTVRLGRSLRFSSEGLDRYVRQRQGR
jgi:excisionase family DNA binding protein